MKRPWWQEPRAWHDSWRRAVLGYAVLVVLFVLMLVAMVWLLSRAV